MGLVKHQHVNGSIREMKVDMPVIVSTSINELVSTILCG